MTVKKRYYIFLLPLLAILLFGSAFKAQKPPFKVLKQRFESGKVLHTKFKYQFKDSFTNKTSTNTGTLWISREKYKIISSPQTILVDGETSKVYDAKRNRLIISKYAEEEDDFAPSRILNGLDSTYTVAQQKQTDRGYVIRLHSKDPFSLYKKITIKLNAKYVPVQIRAMDQANNIVTTEFITPSFIQNQTDLFTIVYPKDAKIVDLRK